MAPLEFQTPNTCSVHQAIAMDVFRPMRGQGDKTMGHAGEYSPLRQMQDSLAYGVWTWNEGAFSVSQICPTIRHNSEAQIRFARQLTPNLAAEFLRRRPISKTWGFADHLWPAPGDRPGTTLKTRAGCSALDSEVLHGQSHRAC